MIHLHLFAFWNRHKSKSEKTELFILFRDLIILKIELIVNTKYLNTQFV